MDLVAINCGLPWNSKVFSFYKIKFKINCLNVMQIIAIEFRALSVLIGDSTANYTPYLPFFQVFIIII